MIKDELRAFIEGSLLIVGNGPISDEDELLLDGMIDSLGVTRLIAFIESELHIAVPAQDATIENFASVRVISDYVERRRSEPQGPSSP